MNGNHDTNPLPTNDGPTPAAVDLVELLNRRRRDLRAQLDQVADVERLLQQADGLRKDVAELERRKSNVDTSIAQLEEVRQKAELAVRDVTRRAQDVADNLPAELKAMERIAEAAAALADPHAMTPFLKSRGYVLGGVGWRRGEEGPGGPSYSTEHACLRELRQDATAAGIVPAMRRRFEIASGLATAQEVAAA